MRTRAKNRSDLRVRRCARPIERRAGSDSAVLGIHGFTGYPGELAYPADELYRAGWDVRIPRLTGHGTCGEDFRGTGVGDWRRQVRDEWLDLKGRYERVCVLGHSMGGLLALDLARHQPVDSIALMAPAVGVRLPGMRLLKPLSLVVERRPYPWEPDPEYRFFDDRDDDDDAYLGAEYWSWSWIRALAGLLDLQKEVERDLAAIRAPILGIFATQDPVVGNRGADILQTALGDRFRRVDLAESGHYIPYDPHPGCKERAVEAVIDWFADAGGRRRVD